jgi:hypothetical protein
MMNLLFRILLTSTSISFLPIIYFVNNGCIPDYEWLKAVPKIFIYIIYCLIPLLFTWLSIFLTKYLSFDEIKEGTIVSIDYANNSFLSSYLGYFFVALSITKPETLIFICLLVFVFTFLSHDIYFNPLFLLFRYNFYNIKTEEGLNIFLISSEKYRLPKEIAIHKAYRINNHTFITRRIK